jgi:predicted secreted acid phosphatase
MSRAFSVWTSGALLAAGLWAGCATASKEPANLTPHKQELIRYVDSGDYDRDLQAVAERARTWIELRARSRKPGEQLCVVMDLDETLLRNWSQMRGNDFGYVPAEWSKWVVSGAAPAIEPIRDLFRRARALGVDVVFITGRPERHRAATEENLRKIQCGDYAMLICAPDGLKTTAAEFKTDARRDLVGGGRVIVANVGDQLSDLTGGFAEKTFKLPNPFYRTN